MSFLTLFLGGKYLLNLEKFWDFSASKKLKKGNGTCSSPYIRHIRRIFLCRKIDTFQIFLYFIYPQVPMTFFFVEKEPQIVSKEPQIRWFYSPQKKSGTRTWSKLGNVTRFLKFRVSEEKKIHVRWRIYSTLIRIGTSEHGFTCTEENTKCSDFDEDRNIRTWISRTLKNIQYSLI